MPIIQESKEVKKFGEIFKETSVCYRIPSQIECPNCKSKSFLKFTFNYPAGAYICIKECGFSQSASKFIEEQLAKGGQE